MINLYNVGNSLIFRSHCIELCINYIQTKLRLSNWAHIPDTALDTGYHLSSVTCSGLLMFTSSAQYFILPTIIIQYILSLPKPDTGHQVIMSICNINNWSKIKNCLVSWSIQSYSWFSDKLICLSLTCITCVTYVVSLLCHLCLMSVICGISCCQLSLME